MHQHFTYHVLIIADEIELCDRDNAVNVDVRQPEMVARLEAGRVERLVSEAVLQNYPRVGPDEGDEHLVGDGVGELVDIDNLDVERLEHDDVLGDVVHRGRLQFGVVAGEAEGEAWGHFWEVVVIAVDLLRTFGFKKQRG